MDYFRSFDGYPMKMMQYRGATGGRGELPGCSSQNRNLKSRDFVDATLSEVFKSQVKLKKRNGLN
jgi:hypothetical protein